MLHSLERSRSFGGRLYQKILHCRIKMNDPGSALELPLPVFVHAMWRTGSTYIWHKFRSQKINRAFMEPLHEYLFDMQEQALRDFLPISITRTMRHPDIDRYYFAEYVFSSGGGLSHFEKYFSYQRYCLDPDTPDPHLEVYILSLLQLAWHNRQRPVLQFNRALLRAGWLAKRFNSRTILVIRSPFDTWKSCLSFENLYFPTVISTIVGQNIECPVVREIARRHDVPCYIADRFADEYQFYHEFAKSSLDRLYSVFYELCIMSNIYAARWADIVIDINEVSANLVARAFITRELRRNGIDLSLDDCAVPTYSASTAAEKRWLSSEQESHAALCSDRAAHFQAPASRVSAVPNGLGPYWRGIFDRYSQ